MCGNDNAIPWGKKKHFSCGNFANCNATRVCIQTGLWMWVFLCRCTKRKLKEILAEHNYAKRAGDSSYPMAQQYKTACHTNADSEMSCPWDCTEQRESFWIYKSYPSLDLEIMCCFWCLYIVVFCSFLAHVTPECLAFQYLSFSDSSSSLCYFYP